MTNQNDPTPTSQGGASVNSASPDNGAVVTESLSLAEINTFLGKDFKDKATALKSLKDTQSFVGKRVEDIRAELGASSGAQADPVLKASVERLERDSFYRDNPQYKDYADLIHQIGGNPAEVVGSPAFKAVFDKIASTQSETRSIVHSNARLAQNQTKMQAAVNHANATRAQGSTADMLASAILEDMGR